MVPLSQLCLLLSPSESKRQGIETRNILFGKPADREDGRLMSQSNHIVGGLEARFFYRTRERGNEELKSKGRTERERQWGSKVKRSSVWQHISRKGQPLEGVC